MGITAENLAKKFEISREAQDSYSVLSHQRAAAARASGRFAEEIVPVVVKGRKGNIEIVDDEHIRPNATKEGLANLNPVFDSQGTITAGNASGINDGAAALLLASEKQVTDSERAPIARIVSWAVTGVDPAYMGIGPVPAI